MDSSRRMVTKYALLVGFSVICAFSSHPAAARDWVVPDQAPTIQSAMDSCVIGDVVVIQAGTYTDCTHLSNGALHIAVLPVGVSVRGATGDPADVVLDAGYLGRCFEIRNNTEDFSIEDITMRRGKAFSPLGKGGAVFAMFANPVFRHCVFDSNYAEFGGGAISAGYGNLTMENCVFWGNETDGIGAAVQVSHTPATLTGCTIQASRGSAVHYTTDDLTLDRCLITFGSAEALVRNSPTDPEPTLTCCDIFGNDVDYDEFFVGNLGNNGNISVDPLYCNPLFGDLHLSGVSACAPENSGDCGLMGALPVNCGTGAETYLIRPDGSGDYPTIQDAINMAATGDTVALANGVFTGEGNRDLDFLGKAITVKGAAGDPELAVIDCQGSLAENHRGFLFQSDELVTSVLRDVSITNGNVDGDGGAILCRSNPLIQNCRFYQNHAERGGAIFCDHGSPGIDGCEFFENEGRARAGGVGFLSSEGQVSGSLFTANWGYMGAAVFLPDSSAVNITGCTITNNANSLDKATIGLDGHSSLNISNSIVANGPHYAFGEYDQGSVSISGCDVYGHGSGDYTGPVAGRNGTAGNISADPLYCGEQERDFTLRGDSPCTQQSAPNGVRMGNQPIGCPAPSLFSDVSDNLPEHLGASSGVSLVDWNNDGLLDLMVTNTAGANEAYDGQGNWSFTEHDPDLANISTGSVAGSFADYDADGDLDLYLSINDLPNFLAENNAGVFTIVQADSLMQTGSAGSSRWGDHNGDGNLDLFIARSDSGSVLMTADGQGGYTNSTLDDLAETGACVSVAWADYDNDGDQDLYLVQDNQPDKLFKNDNGFHWVEGDPLGNAEAGRGAAWADYDNDGDLDLYLAVDGAANQLFNNQGSDEFVTVVSNPLQDEGPGRSGIWGDWDNDGDLDIFLTNCGAADHLLRNTGGTFSDTGDTVFAPADSTEGAAFGDVDNDGDLDLVTAIRGGRTKLFRNNSINGNHWLKLDLRSLQGMKGGTGARVWLTTGADSVQIREVTAGGGWHSSDDPTVHFGLGSETLIDTLKVTWPGGQPLVVTDVAVDQLLVLVEQYHDPESAVPTVGRLRPFRLEPAYPNPFNPSTSFRFAVPRTGRVSLRVYDIAGRLVKILLDETLPAGERSVVWRGRDEQNRLVAAGVYFCRLQAGRFTRTQAVTLVK